MMAGASPDMTQTVVLYQVRENPLSYAPAEPHAVCSGPPAGPVVHSQEAEAVSRAGGAPAVARPGQRWEDHSAETASSRRHQPHHTHTSINAHTFMYTSRSFIKQFPHFLVKQCFISPASIVLKR